MSTKTTEELFYSGEYIKNKNNFYDYLLSNTLFKSLKRSDRNETDESRRNYLDYKNALLNLDDEYAYVIPTVLLKNNAPHLPDTIILQLQKYEIPLLEHYTEDQVKDMILACRMDRVTSYVELNEYYRMLLGLPSMDTDPADYIIVDGEAIHTMSYSKILALETSGRLAIILAQNPDIEYLKYITKRLDIMTIRECGNFEILFTPNEDAFNRYRKSYNQERKVYMATYNNTYINDASQYNEEIELTSLKMRALIIMEIELYNPSLDKKSFTTDECRNIWKTFNLTFPKRMPLEYLNSCTFVLNYLVMFKGTNHVLKYITAKLFNGLKLYKYFVRKKLKTGVSFPVPEGTDPTSIYTVEFILRPYDSKTPAEGLVGSEEEVVLTYDEIVQIDPRWRSVEELKQFIFSSKFSYTESKYLALNNYINLSKFSTDIVVVTRAFIRFKKEISTKFVTFSSTGNSHNFYNLFIYFLALFTTCQSTLSETAPDTLSRIKKLVGFQIPANFPAIKMKFFYMFFQRDFKEVLEQFPDSFDDNDQFAELLVKLNGILPLTTILDDILIQTTNFEETNFILELKRIMEIVDTVPDSYNMVPDGSGMTYSQYLEINDEELFVSYERTILASKDVLILEFDSVVQTILEFLTEQETEERRLKNIKEAFSQTNIFINGISQYLMYILNVFKSYKTDFVSENNILEIDAGSNYQFSVDQLEYDVDITIPQYWNVTQYDQLVTKKRIEPRSTQLSGDSVFMKTTYGMIKIG